MTEWAVTTANASLEFDTANGQYNSCYQIDANHFIDFWAGSGSDGYVQVFTIDTSTWAVTTANASLEFDTQFGLHNNCFQIDSNHFINFWSGGASQYGYVQAFTIDTATWAVSTANASLNFMTAQSQLMSCYKIDGNHFVNFWGGQDGDGYAQVFTVNTATWAVTTANSSLEFDTQFGTYHNCYPIDSNHFINFWNGVDNDGYVQVFTVDTSTWAVTTANSSLEFDTQNGLYGNCYKIDSNHFINFWATIDSDGHVQVFTVDTATWAVTTANSPLEFDTQNGTHNHCCQIDSNHFINFGAGGAAAHGFTQVFTVNTATWAVTTANSSLEFDTTLGTYNNCFQIDSNHFIDFWAGSGSDGYVQVFTVELPAAAPTGNSWYSFAQM